MKLMMFVLIFWLGTFQSCLKAGQVTNEPEELPSEAITTRDNWGIPFIRAASTEKLYEEFGYVMAVDRLWQFETNRRFSKGQLAEIYGPKLVPSDTQTLLFGYSDEEQRRIFDSLSSRSKMLINAYVQGVNRRVTEVLTTPSLIPLEFTTLGIKPQLIDALDIMAFSTALMRRFGFLGGGEFENLAKLKQLRERFSEKEANLIFDDLVWVNDPDAPTYISGEISTGFVPGGNDRKASSAPTSHKNIVQLVHRSNEQSLLADTQAQRVGAPTRFGSLSWTLSSSRTGTGYPILVGQPQMGYMVPNMFAEYHLRSENLNVYGLALPLFPAISIGHNTNIAWSHMVGMGDSVDVYEERLNPADRTQYWFNGGWKPMEVRSVTISVRGESDPRSVSVYRTVHGPVFSPVSFDPAKHKTSVAYSKKLVHWMKEPITVQGWMEINAAGNVDEFSKGAAQIMSSLHSTYADITGNIAYWHTGLVPERPDDFDPRFPMPGTGEAEWTGQYLPKVHAINPKHGYIAGWNNKSHPSVRNPFPTNPNYHFGRYHRSEWVTDTIKSQQNLDLDANKRLIEYIAGAGTWMGNVHNGVGLSRKRLLPHLKKAFAEEEKPDEIALAAIAELETWDGRSALDVVDNTLFQAGHVIYLDWLSKLIRATFMDELKGIHQFDSIDNTLLALLFRALDGNQLVIKNSRDYFDDITTTETETQSHIFRQTFGQTVASLGKKFKDNDVSKWRIDRNKIEFKHDLFGKVAEMYDSNFGTYVQIVELKPTGATGISRWPLGQSSNITQDADGTPHYDPHYLDMLPLYEEFRYRAK